MKWMQALRSQLPAHKYAINAKLLGDDAALAWSNLGAWTQGDTYPEACQALADHLALALQLHSADHVLDLGCGQGASVLHWLERYQVRRISALDLQPACIANIKNVLQLKTAADANVQNFTADLHCGSFLNLNQHFPEPRFDAVMCIDAAYHSALDPFLQSSTSVLNSKGRLGFHYLMLSDDFLNLKPWQKLRYTALLKAADVTLKDLPTQPQLHQQLEKFGLHQICIENISAKVLGGFAQYAQQLCAAQSGTGIAQFKINATGKLCRTLFAEGLVHYVQVSAQKAD